MALEDVLVHTATPWRKVDDRADAPDEADWIEGEPGADDQEPERGTPFPCVLFLPLGSEEAGRPRARQVSRPTMLFLPERDDGSTVDVTGNDELLISAPELAAWTGAAEQRWQVDGAPQPFGPPGEVIGLQATVLKVDD
jgi:hypothetical protein